MATQAAMSILEERLRKNFRSLTFSRLADLHRKAGSTSQAIELCIRGLKNHPDYITGRLILGRCYLEQENLDLAIEAFSNVCRLDRRNVVAIKMLADIFMRRGFSEKAGDLYAIAAKMDPNNEALLKLVSPARRAGPVKSTLLEILGIPLPSKPAQAGADKAVPEVTPVAARAAVPEATSEEVMAEAMEITGNDISERMTEMFGKGETLKAASPAAKPEATAETPTPEVTAEAPAPEATIEILTPEVTAEAPAPEAAIEILTPEATVETPTPEATIEILTPEATVETPTPEAAVETVEVTDESALIEVPDGDTISARIDELFRGEAATSQEASPAESKVEERVSELGPSLEETMILDVEEIKKMRAGDSTPEPESPLIIDEETADESKDKDMAELITDDPVAEDLITEEKESVDFLCNIESSDAPLIAGDKQDEASPVSGAVAPDVGISGDDVAERIDGLFRGKQVEPTGETELSSSAADSLKAARSNQEAVFEKAPYEVDETVIEEQPVISGRDIEKRLDEYFADAERGSKAGSGARSETDALPPAADSEPVVADESGSRSEEAPAPVDKPAVMEESVSTRVELSETTMLKIVTDRDEEAPAPVDKPAVMEESVSTRAELSETTMLKIVIGGDEKASAPAVLPAGGMAASVGDETIIMEETLDAHPLEEGDIDTQIIAPPPAAPVSGRDTAESTAVFEVFSPELVPDAPPSPPEVPLFTPGSGTPVEVDAETVVGNFDIQDKLYDIPDHVLTPTLADLYYQQGQPRLALSIYRRLLEKDGTNVKLRRRIEEIETAITTDELKEQEPSQEKKKAKRGSAPSRRQSGQDTERPLSGVRIKKKPKISWKKKGG